MQSTASSYAIDKWEDQPYRPEVWIEKEALIGVIEGVCRRLDIPYFACRGYNSQSEQWRAGMRFGHYHENGQKPIILHLGDHDPSGMDMTRDNLDRMALFMGGMPVERLALNMNQVEQYNPPPNPAKLTDARAGQYIAEFGSSSWELDALEPKVIEKLIEKAVKKIRDPKKWNAMAEREKAEKSQLQDVADNWEDYR